MSDTTITKKAIRYKAEHRGTKEADYLIGGFVRKILPELDGDSSLTLRSWVEMDDESFFLQVKDPAPQYKQLVGLYIEYRSSL